MFTFVWNKIIHKKWINFCLLFALIILFAVAGGVALFRTLSLDRLFRNTLDSYVENENREPFAVEITEELLWEPSMTEAVERRKGEYQNWQEESTGLKRKEEFFLLTQANLNVVPEYQAAESKRRLFLTPTYLEALEEHSMLAEGEFPDSEEEGVYPCLVSLNTYYTHHLSVGERLFVQNLTDKNGNEIIIKIAGVIKEKESTDAYWMVAPKDFESNLFFGKEAFEALAGIQEKNIQLRFGMIPDADSVTSDGEAGLKQGFAKLMALGGEQKEVTMTSDALKVLNAYELQAKQVKAVMRTLEVPLVLLLLGFLFMVSSKLFEMEQGEIAMLKSRGVSKGQVFLLYLMQAVCMTVFAAAPGMLLGILLAKGLGCADAFLEFSAKSDITLTYNTVFWIYAGFAGLAAVISMTLPVLRLSGLSIIDAKQKKAAGNKKSRKQKNAIFWQKYFLDVLILGISLYFGYRYLKQKDQIINEVLSGESMDPMLFLCGMIFIFGASLLFIRLLHYLHLLIYHIGRKFWKPAAYVSFLQMIRNGHKQNFICIFLILTVALGIFNADIARTMTHTMEERTSYNLGADVVVEEEWSDNFADAFRNKTTIKYKEPDYGKYEELGENVSSMTKVLRDKNITVTSGITSISGVELMGIETVEFGKTAWMKDGVLDRHWYHYLNALASTPNGILVSSNLKQAFDLKVGDTLRYTRTDRLEQQIGFSIGTICGFVDAWPSYSPYVRKESAEGEISWGENYLIVANYHQVVDTFGVTPYEIWMSLAENKKFPESFAAKHGIQFEKQEILSEQIHEIMTDSKVQVTYGLLTLSFVVILILCAVGFLIFWILAIRQREMMFGIYRAMGMRRAEVNEMLVHEQIFTSASSVLAGIGIGILAANIYMPVIMLAYLPEKHSLSYTLITSAGDMLRLGGVIALVLVICFFILAKVVSDMKIANALKMGED